MGAYLSEPLTTKDSSEEANDLLACGSSSMQGWRISQEDAHNCILNYDDKTSFFAVYDGHGGAEVAQYCSLHLPKFLKQLQSYKSKDFEQALKDAFLGFDATLLDEKVIEELKKLSDKTNGEEAIEEDDEEEEDDNVDDLCKEACMPLNEVLQMYKKDKKNPALAKVKEGNCSKPLSPYLKGKRKGLTDGDEPGPSSSSTASSAEADASKSKKPAGADAADSTVSSSSNKSEEASQKPESSTADKKAEQSDEISDTDGVIAKKANKEECAPDSSSAAPTVNGEVGELASKSAVSSSVSAQENGEVSSNTAAGGSSKSMPQLAGSSSSSKSGTNVDSSSAGSSSSAPAAAAGSKKRKAKNGAANVVNDDSDDDDSETDEEFPPVQDSNENSSTEDGEEDPYGEEESEEEEDDEEGEGEYDEEEEDYMNEEDEAFMNNITDEPGKDSGCTAVVALLHDKELFVANAGDSRCVVCRNGKALEMSIDHKPEDQVEFERIQKAGGRVTLDGRVNGGLNLSRAIGDHGYKMNKKVRPEEQMISALPDIKKITIEPEDEFMVLACDGIWNFMTSDDVVEFVQERIADPTKKLTDICEEMFDYCLAPHTKGDGTGCDNMTAIIVQFKPNFTGAASRKRACTPEPETDCKKVKTDAATAGSNGSNCETTSNNEEKEAAAAVASIESSSAAMDTDDNIASSST
ncbi:probable protein phosphatase CG10417 [Aedes aegypti]|uniref:protein-serine/threonine phosphatase n=2 Tax=Aedes aegypti TaxID=7159 RepID=A0A903V3B1_AEDAE|nr:probable protein phosphatase CG10417 [Aedes aegypti]